MAKALKDTLHFRTDESGSQWEVELDRNASSSKWRVDFFRVSLQGRIQNGYGWWDRAERRIYVVEGQVPSYVLYKLGQLIEKAVS